MARLAGPCSSRELRPDMRPSRFILSVALLATAVTASAHELTIGGSRWCIRKNGIVAVLDLDSSLLAKINGLDGRIQDLEPRSEEELQQISTAVLQPYIDRNLAITVNGATRPARVDRLVKAGGAWQIWLSAEKVRLDRPGNAIKIDYRLLFEETSGAHLNIAYVYLSKDEADSVQRVFDFSQPTWQTAFESGATTWEATVPGPASAAVVRHGTGGAAPARGDVRSTASGARFASAKPATAIRASAPNVPSSDEARTAAPASNERVVDEAAPQEPGRKEAWWSHIGRFVLLGIEHILSGYDHIAFLLALIVIAPSIRAVLPIITAFTAAHSITLLLAALRLVTIDSRLVESAIALSICYVAVENLFRTKAAHRWLVTFGFGLVHGFGFASVLQNLIVGSGNLVVSVVSFNVGVEFGQLLILAVMVPVLRLLGRVVGPRRVAIAASVAIAALGCSWILERGFDLRLLPANSSARRADASSSQLHRGDALERRVDLDRREGRLVGAATTIHAPRGSGCRGANEAVEAAQVGEEEVAGGIGRDEIEPAPGQVAVVLHAGAGLIPARHGRDEREVAGCRIAGQAARHLEELLLGRSRLATLEARDAEHLQRDEARRRAGIDLRVAAKSPLERRLRTRWRAAAREHREQARCALDEVDLGEGAVEGRGAEPMLGPDPTRGA